MRSSASSANANATSLPSTRRGTSANNPEQHEQQQQNNRRHPQNHNQRNSDRNQRSSPHWRRAHGRSPGSIAAHATGTSTPSSSSSTPSSARRRRKSDHSQDQNNRTSGSEASASRTLVSLLGRRHRRSGPSNNNTQIINFHLNQSFGQPSPQREQFISNRAQAQPGSWFGLPNQLMMASPSFAPSLHSTHTPSSMEMMLAQNQLTGSTLPPPQQRHPSEVSFLFNSTFHNQLASRLQNLGAFATMLQQQRHQATIEQIARMSSLGLPPQAPFVDNNNFTAQMMQSVDTLSQLQKNTRQADTRQSSMADSSLAPMVRGRRRREFHKCRRVYGLERRAMWCTQCRWKKACSRFQRSCEFALALNKSNQVDNNRAQQNQDGQLSMTTASFGMLTSPQHYHPSGRDHLRRTGHNKEQTISDLAGVNDQQQLTAAGAAGSRSRRNDSLADGSSNLNNNLLEQLAFWLPTTTTQSPQYRNQIQGTSAPSPVSPHDGRPPRSGSSTATSKSGGGGGGEDLEFKSRRRRAS